MMYFIYANYFNIAFTLLFILVALMAYLVVVDKKDNDELKRQIKYYKNLEAARRKQDALRKMYENQYYNK